MLHCQAPLSTSIQRRLGTSQNWIRFQELLKHWSLRKSFMAWRAWRVAFEWALRYKFLLRMIPTSKPIRILKTRKCISGKLPLRLKVVSLACTTGAWALDECEARQRTQSARARAAKKVRSASSYFLPRALSRFALTQRSRACLTCSWHALLLSQFSFVFETNRILKLSFLFACSFHRSRPHAAVFIWNAKINSVFKNLRLT